MEADVKKLNDERKELSLGNTGGENHPKIEKLKSYVLKFVNLVYTPIIKKLQKLRDNTNSKLEHFYFNVIDPINERIERIKSKSPLEFKEFYFNDDLDLRIIVKNKPQGKYSLKILHFEDLETVQKRKIIQILKTSRLNSDGLGKK